MTFDKNMKINPKSFLTNCTYLEHESITIEGINIFGTPYQPIFCFMGFNIEDEKRRAG